MAQITEFSETGETEAKKTHRTSSTQFKSYDQLTKDGTRRSQKLRVLDTVQAQGPISVRQIARLTKLEIGAVCRCIKDLEQNEPPLIKVGLIDRSAETGRQVQHYVDPTWIPKEGRQLNLLQ